MKGGQFSDWIPNDDNKVAAIFRLLLFPGFFLFMLKKAISPSIHFVVVAASPIMELARHQEKSFKLKSESSKGQQRRRRGLPWIGRIGVLWMKYSSHFVSSVVTLLWKIAVTVTPAVVMGNNSQKVGGCRAHAHWARCYGL
jgi:hypothetical protein